MPIWATIAVIIAIILIIIIYQRYHIITSPAIKYEQIANKLKTGDVVLMKQYNFLSSVYMNYFTHTGLVVIINDRPYIFEAWLNGFVDGIPVARSKREIFLVPLEERLRQFNGASYYMELQKQPTIIGYEKLTKFILEALDHYKYDVNILRFIGLSERTNGVVCSELVLLALIELGVASRESLYFHNLANVANLDNYGTPTYLVL